MKKFMPQIISIILFILVIPSLALIPQKGKPQPNKDKVNMESEITKEDIQTNNFYLMFDVNKDEVLKITPLEYIKGVVAGEMPISFSAEALKAQAIAAHSYTLFQIDNELNFPNKELKGAYLSNDSTKFQAYISKEDRQRLWGDNFLINEKKLEDCVKEVIDKVITYEDAPIAAAFHAISSGITESSQTVWGKSLPYLAPVKSEGDSLSPEYIKTVAFKETEIATALQRSYPDIKFNKNREKWFENIEYTESQTVKSIKVGTVTLSGNELRGLLELRSASFTVEYDKALEQFVFTTKGYGHDVGMSQYGADFMARQGMSHEEILAHYYKDTWIEDIGLNAINS